MMPDITLYEQLLLLQSRLSGSKKLRYKHFTSLIRLRQRFYQARQRGSSDYKVYIKPCNGQVFELPREYLVHSPTAIIDLYIARYTEEFKTKN